jgi:hypothetical protein
VIKLETDPATTQKNDFTNDLRPAMKSIRNVWQKSSTFRLSHYRTDLVYWLDVVTRGRDIVARRTGTAPL